MLSEEKKENFGTKSILKDTFVSAIPQIVAIVAGILTSVLLARGLGPKGLGEYTLIISIATLVPALSDLGINQSAVRFASQAASEKNTEAQNSVLRWAFRIRMFLLIAITIILFFVSPYICHNIWHIPKLTHILQLSLLIGIFTTLSAIPTVYFQSLKKFKTNSIVLTLQTILSSGGIVLIAILNKWSLYYVILSSIIAALVSAIFFFHIVPKSIFFEKKEMKNFFKSFFQISQDENIKQRFQKEIHSFTFYYVLSAIICTINTRVDIYIMGAFLNTESIGIYSVAQRVVLPLTLLLTAYQTQLWPKLSSTGTNSEYNISVLKQMKKSNLLIAGGFGLYSIVAPLFIPLLFGDIYRNCILISQLLCFRYCINILQLPINTIGYNYGLAKWYSKINFAQFLCFVTLNMILIPKLGLWGILVSLYVQSIINIIFITSSAVIKLFNLRKKDI